nr:2Fe-2S iron-sulfur cluster-binding protein [Roseateles oligotrophus]
MPGPHQIRAQGRLSAVFEAQGSQSLLQAALAQGVALPSSCRNGTCRACICRLTAGRIAYRIEWPGLSREEKAEGWILPCVAEARSDLSLVWPD